MTKPIPPSSIDRAEAPPGEILYAVGDIHGRADLLDGVLAELRVAAADARAGVGGVGRGAARVTVVFLGDYIDRGPDARGVIARLIAFQGEGVCQAVFLRGNHEQLLLDLMAGDLEAVEWLSYGGVETLRSYGAEQSAQLAPGEAAKLPDRLAAWLPAEHVAFLRATSLTFEAGDYLFVHAGLRPDRLLSEQSDADMLWWRYYADEAPVHGKTVVHGHSPRERPIVSRWRLGIDTEAYASDALTVARLEGDTRELLKFEPGAKVSRWEEPEEFVERPKRRSSKARGGAVPVVSWLSGPGPRVIGALAVLVLLIGAVIGLAERFGLSLKPDPPAAPRAALHRLAAAAPRPAIALYPPSAPAADPPPALRGPLADPPKADPPPADPPAAAPKVQVGALPSADLAQRAGERARRAYAADAKTVQVEKVTTAAGATLYRAYLVGFDGDGEASAFCRKLTAAGAGCIVRKSAG